MEIVIENQTESPVSSAISPNYALPVSGHPFYYSTLPVRRSHKLQPTDFEVSSVRRVDKSGLLEMPGPEPDRTPRHLTSTETHSGTLPRRIDRLGLLEAVPEVPDPAPEVTLLERHLTGAENDQNRIASPRPQKNEPTCQGDNLTTVPSSPYSRRQPKSPSPKPPEPSKDPSADNDKRIGQFTKFLPLDQRNRQSNKSYVDLTGASYTKSNSPISKGRANTTIQVTHDDEIKDIMPSKQTPDCLSRLSPRLRGDRQSMTVSSVPDVIEAHGSKKCGDKVNDGKDKPVGERAEAEGCEHTAIESLEESRVSFKASNKIMHNDNIQTLRVIILSEQL